MSTFDLLTSTLSSSARLWRGTLARPASRQPKALLRLYEFEACPYCRLVREALTELDLDAMIFPTPRGGTRFRPEVVSRGGKAQFPYLIDPNTGDEMYESADIIGHLYRTYADRSPPSALQRMAAVPSSMLSSVVRAAAGARARKSRAPAEPLELYSFESSPFSRRVRELLSELEIAYVLRNTGKAMWQDMGPPSLRRSMFPDLPVEGRNRIALLERTGKVQVPYLVDPNTGAAMFESGDIRSYLLETYALER